MSTHKLSHYDGQILQRRSAALGNACRLPGDRPLLPAMLPYTARPAALSYKSATSPCPRSSAPGSAIETVATVASFCFVAARITSEVSAPRDQDGKEFLGAVECQVAKEQPFRGR